MHAGGREATSGDEVRVRGAQDTGLDIPPGFALVQTSPPMATGTVPGAAAGHGSAVQAENTKIQAQHLMHLSGISLHEVMPRSFDDVFVYFE
eukprot:9495621-Pyramimonas_sp.AAC.1